MKGVVFSCSSARTVFKSWMPPIATIRRSEMTSLCFFSRNSVRAWWPSDASSIFSKPSLLSTRRVVPPSSSDHRPRAMVLLGRWETAIAAAAHLTRNLLTGDETLSGSLRFGREGPSASPFLVGLPGSASPLYYGHGGTSSLRGVFLAVTSPVTSGVRSRLTETHTREELPLPRFLRLSTVAALVGSVLLPFSSSAQAQFGVEIGPRGPRLYEEREPPPRYIERRRRVIEEDYDDCRWIIRRYTNRFGERVERRERVCD